MQIDMHFNTSSDGQLIASGRGDSGRGSIDLEDASQRNSSRTVSDMSRGEDGYSELVSPYEDASGTSLGRTLYAGGASGFSRESCLAASVNARHACFAFVATEGACYICEAESCDDPSMVCARA